MQAKDITTAAFLGAVRATGGYCSTLMVAEALEAPHKVVMAKTRKLIRQGVIEGCECGCSSAITIIEDRPQNLLGQIAAKFATETGIPASVLLMDQTDTPRGTRS